MPKQKWLSTKLHFPKVTKGAFYLSELAGRTIARLGGLIIKYAFFHEFLLNNHFLGAYYLGFD